MTSSAHIICYDIAEPKRLRKVHKLISKEAQRLQYSVYYMECRRKELLDLIAKIKAIINPKEDDVRIYPTPKITDFAWFGPNINNGNLLLVN